jgi:hypothetical protein
MRKGYEDGYGYRELTPSEIAEMKRQANLAAIAERSRPLTEAEVSRMLITQQINTLTVDDNTALRMKSFYPVWAEGSAYSAGEKVQYDGELWRCLQAHTAIVTWEPVNAHSLWERINETHDGTMDDPIPYSGNMALEKGKHYVQGNIIYLCHRDTGNPVHHALAELVGLYVGEV